VGPSPPLTTTVETNNCPSIRPLLTAEVRSRTLCGRHQISEDGRHLVDGIPFGRPYLKQPRRPAVRIPPRKRRRLEEDAEAGAEEAEYVELVTNGETSPLLIGNGSTTSVLISPQAKKARVDKGDRMVHFSQVVPENLAESDDEDEDFDPNAKSDLDVSMASSDSDSDSSSASDSSSSDDPSSEGDSDSDSDSESSCNSSDSETSSTPPDVVSSKTPTQPLVPPNGGSKRTKHRNKRRALTEKLRRLKNDGKLDQNATLDDLRIYLENGEPPNGQPTPANPMSAATGKRKRIDKDSMAETMEGEATELDRRKQEFMANLEMDTSRIEAPDLATPNNKSSQIMTSVAETSNGLTEDGPSKDEAGAAPQRKRLRPDTSAIGRMLAHQTRVSLPHQYNI
jgi:hypothetical protein